MKWILSGIFLTGFATLAKAESNYIYRSKSSGVWTEPTIWERASINDTTDFQPLGQGTYPNRYTDKIIIRHHVQVNLTNISSSELEIFPTGSLEVLATKKIRIYDGAGVDAVISGSFVNSGGTIESDAVGAPAIVFNANGSYINNGGALVANTAGNLSLTFNANSSYVNNIGTSVTTGNPVISFLANSLYKQNNTTGFGQIPIANWDINSTVEFAGYTSLGSTPSAPADGFNQAFGNVRWNTANNASSLNLA